MNALLIVLAVVSVEPGRVKRYAEAYQKSAGITGKIDRLSGLECQFAFMIHPKTERAPAAVDQPLREWARSQNWRGRLVVMEFDGYPWLGKFDTPAQYFIEVVFPKIQGPQSLNLRAIRIDTTVIWGDGDAIERARGQ